MASGFDFHWFDKAGNGPFGLHFDDLESLIAFAESGVGMTLSGDPITDVTQYATDSETGQPVTASDLPGAQLPTDPNADPLTAPPVTTAPTAPDVSTQAPTAAGTPPESVVTPAGGPDPSGSQDGSPAPVGGPQDSSGAVAGPGVTDAAVPPLTPAQQATDGTDVAPLPANVDAPAPASDAPADSSSTTGQTEASSTDQAAPDAAPADAQADDQADLERNSEDGPETAATAPGIGAPVDGTDPAVSTGAEGTDSPQAPAGDDVTPFPADGPDASPLYSETAAATGVTPTAPSS